MQSSDTARRTEFLGRDFLVWLWFKSETEEDGIVLGDGAPVSLSFEHQVTFESEGDESGERIICRGEPARMREASLALSQNKKICQAKIRLALGSEEWTFVLDSRWMEFRSLKTPPVVQDNKSDPAALLLETLYLLEQPLATLDRLFATYILLRVSPQWEEVELPRIRMWIEERLR